MEKAERILRHNKFDHNTEQKVSLVLVALKTKMIEKPRKSIFSKARNSHVITGFQERKSGRHTREEEEQQGI